MSDAINWMNPYADRRGLWLRGNLHTHTAPASPCGQMPLEQALTCYAESGYDFLAISDHMTLTPAVSDQLTLLSGMEWNRPDGGGHVGIYACDAKLVDQQATHTEAQELLSALAPTGALVILNHPNWQLTPHYRREKLLELQGYDGIEIYNGVIEVLDGSADSTDKWDYLLMHGRRVLGFANDDAHAVSQIGHAWNVVRAHSNSPADILHALHTGNFYASSGVRIVDITRRGNLIDIDSEDGQEIQCIKDGGIIFHTTRDRFVKCDLGAIDCRYVRFAIYGAGSTMAWTQPFFKDA